MVITGKSWENHKYHPPEFAMEKSPQSTHSTFAAVATNSSASPPTCCGKSWENHLQNSELNGAFATLQGKSIKIKQVGIDIDTDVDMDISI